MNHPVALRQMLKGSDNLEKLFGDNLALSLIPWSVANKHMAEPISSFGLRPARHLH